MKRVCPISNQLYKIFFIIGLRSVYERGIRGIGLFNADLAALSAFSLPEMPT